MLIGYARTSTLRQDAGLDAQKRDLAAAGAEKVFEEQVSSIAERVQLTLAVEFCRKGDTLIVTKLDRLARSIKHLWEIVEELERKKVALRILNLGIDTGTPTGRLMLTLIGGIAQFEREIMLERQREGIAKARAERKYKGRKPSIDPAEVKRLLASGLGATAVARQLGCHRDSVYRLAARLTAMIPPRNGAELAFVLFVIMPLAVTVLGAGALWLAWLFKLL